MTCPLTCRRGPALRGAPWRCPGPCSRESHSRPQGDLHGALPPTAAPPLPHPHHHPARTSSDSLLRVGWWGHLRVFPRTALKPVLQVREWGWKQTGLQSALQRGSCARLDKPPNLSGPQQIDLCGWRAWLPGHYQPLPRVALDRGPCGASGVPRDSQALCSLSGPQIPPGPAEGQPERLRPAGLSELRLFPEEALSKGQLGSALPPPQRGWKDKLVLGASWVGNAGGIFAPTPLPTPPRLGSCIRDRNDGRPRPSQQSLGAPPPRAHLPGVVTAAPGPGPPPHPECTCSGPESLPAGMGSPGVTPCTITGVGPPARPPPARVTVRWAGRTQAGQEEPAGRLTLGQECGELPGLLILGGHRRAIHHCQLPGE